MSDGVIVVRLLRIDFRILGVAAGPPVGAVLVFFGPLAGLLAGVAALVSLIAGVMIATRDFDESAKTRAADALAEHYITGGSLLATCWCGWEEQPDCDETGDTIERHLVDQVVTALQRSTTNAPQPDPD